MLLKYDRRLLQGVCNYSHARRKEIMNIELYIAIMAGFVLAFFLMVSEIMLMRKRVVAILTRLRNYYRSGKYLRLFLSTLAMLALILVQPLIVGLLVVMALDKVDPHFSTSVIREIRQGLSGIIG
ncbi:hypothetical protein GALL_15130 [mine drainage metagenome]|uniref:Uncharacterized protein n=1 Tax=mine drainage metagenome TaxID=410659 RepID=A0A1J5TBC6_9ZZZZ